MCQKQHHVFVQVYEKPFISNGWIMAPDVVLYKDWKFTRFQPCPRWTKLSLHSLKCLVTEGVICKFFLIFLWGTWFFNILLVTKLTKWRSSGLLCSSKPRWLCFCAKLSSLLTSLAWYSIFFFFLLLHLHYQLSLQCIVGLIWRGGCRLKMSNCSWW